MGTSYKIILVSSLAGNLSELGEQLLSSARHSNDQSKIIKSINHSQERIAAMFKDGFDYHPILSSCETITKDQSLIEMQTFDWVSEMTSEM